MRPFRHAVISGASTAARRTRVPSAQRTVSPSVIAGAVQMKKGGKYTLFIPAEQGYGAEGQKDQQGTEVIPPNSDLTFDVELVDFMSEADAQRRFQVLQQMMEQQQGAQGAAPGPRGRCLAGRRAEPRGRGAGPGARSGPPRRPPAHGSP